MAFHLYIANLTAKPANLPKLKVVSFGSNAPMHIKRVRDDKPHMLRDEGVILTQCHNFEIDPTLIAAG